MSKTGAYYLDMQEDAENLTKDDFIKKHGEHNLDIWNEVNEDVEIMQSRLNEVVSRMNKAFTKKISQ